jgi:plasmid stabilization system protein ParE
MSSLFQSVPAAKRTTAKRCAGRNCTDRNCLSFLAVTRLRQIRTFVAQDRPEAAERLALRIVTVVEALRNHPRLGRPGAESDVRELVFGGTPYIVFYRIQGKRVTISTIHHGARRKR